MTGLDLHHRLLHGLLHGAPNLMIGLRHALVVERARKGKRGYNAASEREATYYLGMYEMNRRSYEKALEHFFRCDELSRGLDRDRASGFMVMANLKIGMIYDKLSRRDFAIGQYEKVLEMHEFRNSHEEAERYLQSPFAN